MTARAMLVAGAATLTALPALAQSSDAGATASIAGSWSFQTEVYDGDGVGFGPPCQMTGELHLSRTSDPDVLEGRMTAYESCEGRLDTKAEQTSVARRDGDQLVIESAIESVVVLPLSDGDPTLDQPMLPKASNYWPDNFALAIVNGSLMVGELRSADIAPVMFRRDADLIG